MDWSAALDRVMWLATHEPHILDVAEVVVRISVANHNVGAEKVICDLAEAKNIFIAVTTLVQTTTGCTAVDARLTAALHMLRAGWPAPYKKELGELVTDASSMAVLEPYFPKYPVLKVRSVEQVEPEPIEPEEPDSFRSRLQSALDDFMTDHDMSLLEVSKEVDISYSTLNAWKSGARTPRVAKCVEVMNRMAKLKKKLTAR